MDAPGGSAPEAPAAEQPIDGIPAPVDQQLAAQAPQEPQQQNEDPQPEVVAAMVEIEVPAADAPMPDAPSTGAAAGDQMEAEVAAAAAAAAPAQWDAARDDAAAAAAAAADSGADQNGTGADTAGGTAGGGGGGVGDEDELAASLLSNMAAWQTELDTFQAALRRCMESAPNPDAAQNNTAVDETGRGAARLMHSGPKGITGYRGVTQHKRTKRYEANVWMDHKQMYLGAFDAPEQAAHAHDIGALCSGKARTEALNFPLTDYDQLLPMLYSLPHAQVVAALRGYGRLPTARPPGGISSGRLFNSPSARSASAGGDGSVKGDGDDDGEEGQQPRSRRLRPSQRPSSASGRQRQQQDEEAMQPMDWHAVLLGPQHQQQQQQQVKHETDPQQAGGDDGQQQQQQQQQEQQAAEGGPAGVAAVATTASSLLPGAASWSAAEAGAKADPAAVAAAHQAQLQALSAALTGGVRVPSALSGAGTSNGSGQQDQQPAAAAAAAAPQPAAPKQNGTSRAAPAGPAAALLLSSLQTVSPPGGANPVGAFEAVLWRCMSQSHQLPRPEDEGGEGAVPRPLHSGPKGQSGFKGVTLYKRCQRYNAHIWLGKQTHIGTFHTAEQAAVAHDVMELWRNEAAQGLNFAASAYAELLPLLKTLSEADALLALRTYSRSPAAVAAAAAGGSTLPNRCAPPRAQPGTQRQQAAASGDASTRAEPAAAAAAAQEAAPVLQAPSLRRRHRKPQHQAGGQGSAGGARSDDSSGGSAPVGGGRQSAGSLMWYMLEQERAADDDISGEPEDPDFSPAEAAAQASKRVRGSSSETPYSAEPLGFQPASCPSVVAALSSDIPAEQAVLGARPPRAGSSHRWGVAVSMRGQAAWFGRLDRQRAAVAADVVLAWRRCTSSPAVDEEETAFNVPSVGYEQDGVLMDQLRRIKTAPQLCQFMAAVIPQDAPAAPFTSNAAAGAGAPTGPLKQQLPPQQPVSAAAVAGMLLGGRKRKQQALLEEARAAKQQNAGGGGGTASPLLPPLPPGLPTRSGNSSAAVTPAVLGGGLAVATAASAAPVTSVAAAAPAQQQQQQQQAPVDDVVAQAAAAVAAADVNDSASMLAALCLLVAAGKGGHLLKDVVSGWQAYPLMQQQDLFGALKLPVSSGDWDQVEGRLQVALDLASLF